MGGDGKRRRKEEGRQKYELVESEKCRCWGGLTGSEAEG